MDRRVIFWNLKLTVEGTSSVLQILAIRIWGSGDTGREPTVSAFCLWVRVILQRVLPALRPQSLVPAMTLQLCMDTWFP